MQQLTLFRPQVAHTAVIEHIKGRLATSDGKTARVARWRAPVAHRWPYRLLRPSGTTSLETGPEHEVTHVTVDVTTETLIERDRQTVAQYALDPSNAPTWYANIDSVEWETEPPIVVGSRMAFVARFLGRRLVYTYEVTDLTPNERLVMRTSQGPFPMETTYTWATTPSGATRMTLRNRGEPTGFSRPAGPFIATAMRRANRKDLSRLKSLLEER
jgi:hypothetical protein